MRGPYVHQIDPVLGTVGGVHLWWYGLSYALAFAAVLRFLLGRRTTLGLTRRDARALSLMFVIGLLLGGRAVQVGFDEWPL